MRAKRSLRSMPSSLFNALARRSTRSPCSAYVRRVDPSIVAIESAFAPMAGRNMRE